MQAMTRKEVAEYLNVHEMTIFEMVQVGTIPAYKVGNRWRFDKNAIDRWKKRNSNKKPVE